MLKIRQTKKKLQKVKKEQNMKNNQDLFEFSTNYVKDVKSKASNLLRRRHTEASFSNKSILPSREEIYKWQTSFEHLLRHKYGIAIFRGFLKTEFSDENIEFWLECEEYKFTNKDIKRQAKAKKNLRRLRGHRFTTRSQPRN